MSDPGTCLAIVSLALQVSKGLLGYYDLWTHADEDIAEIQRSLLALANIFIHLEITLGKPSLSGDIVSVIQLTMKGCKANMKKLEDILDKVKREAPRRSFERGLKTSIDGSFKYSITGRSCGCSRFLMNCAKI